MNALPVMGRRVRKPTVGTSVLAPFILILMEEEVRAYVPYQGNQSTAGQQDGKEV